MKKIIERVIIAALAVICIVSQTACSSKEPVSDTDFLMNTTCKITVYGDARSEKDQLALIRETFALCRQYEDQMSRTVEGGDISRINSAAGQPVSVEDSTAEVIEAGLKYAELSGGLFDITVGELAEMWNFSGDDPHVPDAAAIAEAVKHVGYQKVHVSRDGAGEKPAVRLDDPETKLDLGGIAKGYIADRAAEFLREKGVTGAILNFGGNILCIGEKDTDTPFVIGVEKPFSSQEGQEKEILGTVAVSDMSVVTSGTYERKFYEDGVLYYHILDPQTGYPRETDLDGVSIMGPDSADCDGLATTCLMLGLDKGKALIESLPDFEALFAVKDGSVVTTEGFTLKETK